MNRQVVARNAYRYGPVAATMLGYVSRNRYQMAQGFGRAAGWAARRIQRAWRNRGSARARVGAKRSRGNNLRGSTRRPTRRSSSAVSTSAVYNSQSHLQKLPSYLFKSGIEGIAKIASRLHAPVTIKANRTYNVDCNTGRCDRQISMCLPVSALLVDKNAVNSFQVAQGGATNVGTLIAIGPYFETYQGVNNSTAPIKVKINVYRYKQDSSVSISSMYSSTTDTTNTVAGYAHMSSDHFNFDLMSSRITARDNLRRVAKRSIHLAPGNQFKFSVGWAKQRVLDVFKLEQIGTTYMGGWTFAVEFVITGAVAFESNTPSDTVISTSMGHLSIVNSMTNTLVAFENARRQVVYRSSALNVDDDVYGQLTALTNDGGASENQQGFINPVTGASTVYAELR